MTFGQWMHFCNSNRSDLCSLDLVNICTVDCHQHPKPTFHVHCKTDAVPNLPLNTPTFYSCKFSNFITAPNPPQHFPSLGTHSIALSDHQLSVVCITRPTLVHFFCLIKSTRISGTNFLRHGSYAESHQFLLHCERSYWKEDNIMWAPPIPTKEILFSFIHSFILFIHSFIDIT